MKCKKFLMALLLMLVVPAVSLVASPPDCPQDCPPNCCPPGYDTLVKFEWKDGAWVPTPPVAGINIVGDAVSGTWSSTSPVAFVMIVKGGPCYTSGTPSTGGSYSNTALPEVGAGNYPAISFLEFCGPKTEIPEFSTIGIILAAVLGVFGVLVLRRKKS